MNVPESLLYTKEHEWAQITGDVATIGITDHAQSQLGDVTYVELPKIGDKLNRETSFGVVESVKAVSDLYAPITGQVVEINDAIKEKPEGINEDPYGDAWLIKIKIADKNELKHLLSAQQYEELISSTEE